VAADWESQILDPSWSGRIEPKKFFRMIFLPYLFKLYTKLNIEKNVLKIPFDRRKFGHVGYRWKGNFMPFLKI